MTEQPTCPLCGAPTRRAFATTPDYVTCTRNGHVTRTQEDPS